MAQENLKSTIAEKGEGIYALLRRNGLNPDKNLAEFKKINQAFLKNNDELIVGQKYFLPGNFADNTSLISNKEVEINDESDNLLKRTSNKPINEREPNGDKILIVDKDHQIIETENNTDMELLDASLIENGVKEIIPGSSINLVIMLTNNSKTAKEFHLKITAPEAWSLLNDYSSVMVGKNSKKIKVLSFYIQESTLVGTDTIKVEVFNKMNSKMVKLLKIPVLIKPRYEIAIETLPTQDYVFAGDSLIVHFRVRNLSNLEIDINTKVTTETSVEDKMLSIKPDSYANMRIPFSTKKDILIYTRKSVHLTATIVGKPEVSVTNSFSFDVIPSITQKFDAYDRIPISIRSLAISDERNGEKRFGYMFDISAKGMISPNKKRMVEFRVRLPDKEGNPVFGLNREYFAKYSSNHLNIVVGDHNYRLTDLTESSRHGQGVGVENIFKKLMLGAFLNYPKYYPNVTQVYSVYSSYFPTKNFKINLGYLNKTFITNSIVELLTVSGTTNLTKWALLDFEYANGMENDKTSSAYKGSLKLSGSKIRTYFNYTMADKDFPGYFSNSKYLSAGISTSIIPKSNISASYELNHINSALDTIYSNAPLSTNISFLAMFRIKKVNSLGFAVYKRKREDRFEQKLFNYEEYTGRITFQNRIKRFALNFYGEMGKINNLLVYKEGELTTVYKSYLSMDYKVSNSFSLDVFANYQGGQYYKTRDLKSIYYGASLDAIFWKKLSIVFEYQNNYEMEEYYKDRSLISSRISLAMNNKHEFGLSANYNLTRNTLNNKELSVALSYNYIINVPVAKKKDICSLKGRVINKGVENIEGIIFTLSGNIAHTDKNGFFEFPIVKTGIYYLLMNDAITGLNTIAETPGPYKIEILPGETKVFEIVLTKSSRITGKIIIQEDSNINSREYIPVKEQLGNLIIEISKGNEVYRVFSNKTGYFNFEDLRTGVWQLKVYDKGIPSGYQLVTKELKVELSSGEVKIVEVLIKKEVRKIKFQKII